ncbi:PREDICTED: sulfide:quinone oxidoreductase, mitochondrial-like [Amphimedon queenslandica]|uniref:Sulfide:quinone oxidoreductase, mitochondrial n=1 Tax=Amphimedon queenslandica TaxID=400682 RepID=A0A1X7VSG7_AMPQE|nr:PREDICTED: sulfide:quinone oxidoreductase, mitochondrial-like [Amphimedon queenslandica]|eukprot:XP_003382833.1 PREDICTED: sulfide:quinone oxidoreductase, mitochondrial-like [Amphimedon queenslandica]
MNSFVCKRLAHSAAAGVRSHQFVVCGGGTGGLAVASSLARRFGKDKVAVIEPSDVHYYQPMWTMVGAGIKTLEQSRRPMADVMPQNAAWYKTAVTEFEPSKSAVHTQDGTTIKYDYLIVGLGLKVDFDRIKGLTEALEMPSSGVSSNYSSDSVTKTYEYLNSFKGGEAIFTFPPLPIKCPGAPQKIMYLAEELFKRNNVRDKTRITYNSAIGVIFGVKKYANELLKVISRKGIDVNFQHNLVEIIPERKEAIFEVLKEGHEGERKTFSFDFMHATPPMGPLDVIKESPLADGAGWLDVNPQTMQHKKFENVFGIGDCTNVPTSKTAAACAAESAVLKKNLFKVMKGQNPDSEYDGYTSCPLVTGYNTCILAEFDYTGTPLETFPFDQGKERQTMYYLKADILPEVYWHGLIKGLWGGPKPFRKAMKLGLSK